MRKCPTQNRTFCVNYRAIIAPLISKWSRRETAIQLGIQPSENHDIETVANFKLKYTFKPGLCRATEADTKVTKHSQIFLGKCRSDNQPQFVRYECIQVFHGMSPMDKTYRGDQQEEMAPLT